MAEILLWIIFIGTFYFVFKFIWTHVTTVSHSGLKGFIHSWWEQFLWAFVIAGVVTAIAAHILESVMNFGRGLNFGFSDIFIGGVVVYVLFAIFSSSDTFDRKTFRENYNRHVVELSKKLDLSGDVLCYFEHDTPGNLVNLNDERETYQLTLAEDFISNGRSTFVQFPSMSINHHFNKSGNYTSIRIFLKSKRDEVCSEFKDTAEYDEKMVLILTMERLIANIAFTAAIEAVAEGKSRAIENSLHLIDDKGLFNFWEYISDSEEKVTRESTEDAIEYTVSRTDNGDISLRMIKRNSEDK